MKLFRIISIFLCLLAMFMKCIARTSERDIVAQQKDDRMIDDEFSWNSELVAELLINELYMFYETFEIKNYYLA